MCPEPVLKLYSESRFQEQQYVAYPKRVAGKLSLGPCCNLAYVWNWSVSVCATTYVTSRKSCLLACMLNNAVWWCVLRRISTLQSISI